MTDQNSAVEIQIRPNELMDQLGIKKDAYYAYLKALDITAEKDSNNKAYLTEDQAKLVRLLRQHVVAGGKIDEFDLELALQAAAESALAIADSGEIGTLNGQPDPEPTQEIDLSQGLDMEALYREASEIAVERLTASERVVMAMASKMTYEDLHPEAKAKVDHVRTASVPKFNPHEVADSLLSQFRQQMQAA
ncbi:hypothetical protein IQ260_14700 [Leptolyngbya cf. ectocarpi LEGE 11479]|uniref:Uncharacterized protein n=1 Tax=Leptolyngbya cf. ectocarpi LEGE 11479 TaxID=1828722 RepID=A0A928ZUW0_LEPEC|nr:hypothetical protein [Leptolyngbya ectocarpi]MBE9067900.1 hypothetical protein [Leptolyngbya cf. ectocarpi LEGE 11479]